MSEQEQKLEQPADEAESREDEMTRRVTPWFQRPLATVLLAICVYYGGSEGGDAKWINHAAWQDAILWPVFVISFVLIIIDVAGPPRKVLRGKPHRRVSRWIARRLIARQEQQGIGS